MPKVTAELASKGTVLGGLRGSGKTNAARYIASLHPDNVLVYDPLDQYPDFDILEPKHRDYPEAADEFARMLDRVDIWDGSKHPYRLLVVDEAHRVAPSGRNMHRSIARLNHEHRHIPLGIVWITRRPRELHPEIVNLADHLMIWRLPGATDYKFLEDTVKGLGEEVRSLRKFHFVYADQDRRFQTARPFPEMPVPQAT